MRMQNPFLQQLWEGVLDIVSLPVIFWKGDADVESLPAASEDADVWSPAPHTQPSPAISYQGFDNSRLLRNRRVTASLCLLQRRGPPGHSLNIWALILHLKPPPLSGRVVIVKYVHGIDHEPGTCPLPPIIPQGSLTPVVHSVHVARLLSILVPKTFVKILNHSFLAKGRTGTGWTGNESANDGS